MREEPFYYETCDHDGKHGWSVYIDETPDESQVVYHMVHNEIAAKNLTNRLNNAVYRWIVRHGLQISTDAQQGQ